MKLAGAIDTPAVLARRDDFVEHYQDGAEVTLLENYQATFVRGQGTLSPASIAVTAEVPLDRLWHAVPAFPTRSEIWLQLLEAYGL